MIERRGIVPAVEALVCRSSPSIGYTTLVEIGMEDLAFEAVVLRHPEHFSNAAIERSRVRLAQLGRPSADN